MTTSSSQHNHIKLTYLDYKFIGEPIRLTLFIGNIPFEDERITHEELNKRRHAGLLPFGQLPVLNVNGTTYAQSSAILRWAGQQSNMYTTDTQLQCNEILGVLEEMNVWFRPLWFQHILGRNPATGDKMVEMTEEQNTEAIAVANTAMFPMMLSMLERRLGEKKFFCGDVMTIADVTWYVMGSGILDGTYEGGIVRADVLKSCDNLLRLVNEVGGHPRVVLWNSNHK